MLVVYKFLLDFICFKRDNELTSELLPTVIPITYTEILKGEAM